MAFRYRKLDRGGDRFIWDTKTGEMWMLDPGTEDWILRDLTINVLEKWGYLEDLGGRKTFPGKKIIQVSTEGEDDIE